MISEITTIGVESLTHEVRSFKQAGYRLVQIGATRLPGELELTYSFDKELDVKHLRVCLPIGSTEDRVQAGASPRLPSISSIYWGAFLYENELHDLFNVQVDGITIDFHGSFYKTAIKFPFGSTKPPGPKPVTTTKPNPASQVAEAKGVPKAPCTAAQLGEDKQSPAAPINGAPGSPVRPQPPANTN